MMTRRKLSCLFLLALLLFCLTACGKSEEAGNALAVAFDSGNLTLREVSIWPEEPSDFTVSLTQETLVALQEHIPLTDADKLTPGEGSRQTLCPGSQTYAALQGLWAPLSIGPDGTVLLHCDEMCMLAALKDDCLTILDWNDEKSVVDTYNDREHLEYELSYENFYHQVDPVVWSPDGRYASFCSNFQSFTNSVPFELFLLDMHAGELIQLTSAINNYMDINYAALSQVCFDASGRYLYYTLLSASAARERVFTLLRCDLNTLEITALAVGGQGTPLPCLWETSDGSVFYISEDYAYETQDVSPWIITRFTSGKDGWSVSQQTLKIPEAFRETILENSEQTDDLLRKNILDIQTMQYSANSGYALMLSYSSNMKGCALLRGRIDENGISGFDSWWYLMDADSAQMLDLTLGSPGDWLFLEDYGVERNTAEELTMDIKQPIFSPDGQYALLLIASYGNVSCQLLRLSDMTLCPVECPESITHRTFYNGLVSSVTWAADGRLLIQQDDDTLGVYVLE